MYCGIPPVVFPYGGVKKLIINGETGIIVSPENPHELASAIMSLEKNRLKAMADKITAYKKRLTWANYVDSIIELSLTP